MSRFPLRWCARWAWALLLIVGIERPPPVVAQETVATWTWKDGDTLILRSVRDSTAPGTTKRWVELYVAVAQGGNTTRLSAIAAHWWSFAAYLVRGFSPQMVGTFEARDTTQSYGDRTAIDCRAATGCYLSVRRTPWGRGTFRVGPLSFAEVDVLRAALLHASGVIPADPKPAWPYTWREP